MKRVLSFILVLTLMMGLAVSASAKSGWEYDEWLEEWVYKEDTTENEAVSLRDWNEHWEVTTAENAIANWTEGSIMFLQPDETYLKLNKTVYVNRKKKYSAAWADEKVEKWTAVTVKDIIDAGYETTRVLVLKDSTTELKKGAVLRINKKYDAILSTTGTKRTTQSKEEKSTRENNLEVDLRW